MLTELRNRGLQDALIVCCDGLKGCRSRSGSPGPRRPSRPAVHMVRNSLRYSSKKHWARITAAMREIYTAPTVEAAEARFAEFAGEWQQLYPAMIQAWQSVWRSSCRSRVSRRASQGRLHHERDRVLERPLPQGRPPSGPLPNRTGRAQEVMLACISIARCTPTVTQERAADEALEGLPCRSW